MRPDRIGRYQVLRELGRGAMGVVYLAHDPAIDRNVAIKTVAIGQGLPAADQEEARKRFQREARAAGQLIHPGIVLVFDVGHHDSQNLFIAMEHIQGSTLEVFTRTPDLLPSERAVDLMAQACDALDFAHKSKIVHRDIKPANLMVVDGERLKITDFGLAKDPGSELTHTGTLVGTPNYMSPEQIRGAELDGRTDLFSLGVVLYELLTGEKPFVGDSISTVIYRILNEEPARPCSANPQLAPPFDALLARALHKAPEARFQTGAEMAAALRNYTEFGQGSPAGAGSTLVAGARPTAPRRERPAPSRPARPPRRAPRREGSGRKLAIGLLAAVVLGGAIVALHPPTRRFWERTVPGMATVLHALPGWDGAAGAGAVDGPHLVLRADRRGAVFAVDGVEIAGRALAWGPGLAGAVVSASDGCRRGERVLSYEAGEAGRLELSLDQPVLHRVTLTSAPPGAAVKLDGRPTGGVTPIDLEVPACEAHDVVLSLPYHRNARLALPADADWARLTEEPVPLYRLPEGRLRVRSDYPVLVREDGLRVGESGQSFAIPAGEHELEFVNEEYRVRVVQSVLIGPGAEEDLRAPVPRLGEVRVNALPGNAVILVDGQAVGPPPLTLTLGAGEHDFECRWNVGPGWTMRRTVHLLEGDDNAPVNFRARPRNRGSSRGTSSDTPSGTPPSSSVPGA